MRLQLAELHGAPCAVRSGPTSAIEHRVCGALCVCVQIFIRGGGVRLAAAAMGSGQGSVA